MPPVASRERWKPPASLTTAEFDVLLAFCLNPGRIMTREQLLELTHAGAAGPVGRSMYVHASRIRQKIDRDIKAKLNKDIPPRRLFVYA